MTPDEEAFERPLVLCPRCDAEYEDFDGFGVIYCDECGYCQHVSATGNGSYICDLCGVSDESD